MSGLITDGPARHEHTLPEADGLKPGAVAQCPCGRFFVLDPIPWEQVWRPVHWWDRRARRAIREREQQIDAGRRMQRAQMKERP